MHAEDYSNSFILLFFSFCLILTTTINAHTEDVPEYVPQRQRYNRFIFFFLSENVTITFFNNSIVRKLIQLDDYCGGENVFTFTFFGSERANPNTNFNIFSDVFSSELEPKLNESIARNIQEGSIDHEDVKNVSRILLSQAPKISGYAEDQSVPIISQVILITDYVTDSLASNTTSDALALLKTQKNITFIALTTALNDTILKNFFRNDVWSVTADYMSWAPNETNPLCGYDAHIYTTPSPPFSGTAEMHFFLFCSHEYVSRTLRNDVADLLINMMTRRWQYPCRQYRNLVFHFHFPGYFALFCNIEDVHINQGLHTCSVDWFNKHIRINASSCSYDPHSQNPCLSANGTHDYACETDSQGLYIYGNIFKVMPFDKTGFKNKYFLITDLAIPACAFNVIAASGIFEMLSNYSDYSSGAPLTVIAIDKKNDKSVANSFLPIFPPTQMPNLHQVNEVADLLLNMSETINFCLDSVPWLSDQTNQTSSTAPDSHSYNPKVVWYFYIIGAAALIIFVIFICAILILRKRFKRRENLRQFGDGNNNSLQVITSNSSENNPQSAIADVWEVQLKSLDIDFTTLIGKGAFSVVYSGYLRGQAPVLQIFPLIALQQFTDCDVAVKTLPRHSDETDKIKFRQEIELMKDIGYNVHLVSLLGCNCSIERPIMLMELAEQDLLQWLLSKNSSTMEIETDLAKTLLSISWQLSDGMCYLSAKRFIHRDLAARNVLLNTEMKAMISDFGLCRKLSFDQQSIVIPGEKLPLKWTALETLQEHEFSIKTDVWSFGVLLFEIFSLGQEPYEEVAIDELITFLHDGRRLKKPALSTYETYDLMNSCWRAETSQRPDFFTIQSYFAALLENMTANYDYLPPIEMEMQSELAEQIAQ